MPYQLESANATRVRTIRLDDRRWQTLTSAATAADRSASEVLRDLIDLYDRVDRETGAGLLALLTRQRDEARAQAEAAEHALAKIRQAVA